MTVKRGQAFPTQHVHEVHHRAGQLPALLPHARAFPHLMLGRGIPDPSQADCRGGSSWRQGKGDFSLMLDPWIGAATSQ